MSAHRRLLMLLVVIGLIGGLFSANLATAGGRATDQPEAVGVIDNQAALQEAIRTGREITVIVQLKDPPLASYTGGIRGIGRTKPAPGRKLDLTTPEARAYTNYLAEQRGAFIAYLRSAAPSARIIMEYKTVLNGVAITLNGKDLSQVLRGPGVQYVTVVRQFRPLMNISRGLVGAPAVDADLAGLGQAPGEGMKIAIVDTGIFIGNPFFADTGYSFPSGFPKADNAANLALTNKKVIVARSYPIPPRVDSAADTNGHGSHVAGTAAGNSGVTATVSGVTISGLSGIAHRAWLGNYNVFPDGQESTTDVYLVRAVEDLVNDGMDVFNMSIGGPVLRPSEGDPAVRAVNAAAEAGVIPVIAAGNSGPRPYTVESPGIAESAITAAASTNPHFVGQPVTVTEIDTFGGAVGDFDSFPDTTNTYVWWGAHDAYSDTDPRDGDACEGVTTDEFSGKIALIKRGRCFFTQKILNAQAAGAVGVIIFNHVAGDPVAMGHFTGLPFPAIPAIMVSLTNGLAMKNVAPRTVSISATFAEFITSMNLDPFTATANADIIAGFSSRGPVPFDNRLKPDVAAPGVNVLSAINTPADFAFFQGTSMATPHITGAAALLKQLHPNWTVEQVKSALITLAKRPVFSHITGTGDAGVLARGGGRINLAASKGANATFSPPNFSFGLVQPKNKTQSVTVDITLRNVGSAANAWTITAPGAVTPFVNITASPTSTGPVSSGGTFTFTVTATVLPGAAQTIYGGDILVSDGVQTHRLPWILVHLENVAAPPP